ncbi:MAG TPA: hypothetical protein VMZ06_00595 [Candidatus Bathyarchaeia archaeon]|nr:hypothetical protein [Candidatus Bathyarchaeia archaeon]
MKLMAIVFYMTAVAGAGLINLISGPSGMAFEDRVLVPNSVMDLACAADGTVYYADYFEQTVGTLDLATQKKVALLEKLNSPKSLAIRGEWLYFVEVGTEEAKYKDGTLSRIRLPSGPRELIAGGLEYPNSVCASKDGSIYVLEAAGGCTSFGGNHRLIMFRNGSAPYEEVFTTVMAPEGIVLDSEGNIYIGAMGQSSPGDTGKILRYAKGSKDYEVLVGKLPALQDLAIDAEANIFAAGNSESTQVGVFMVPRGSRESVDLKLAGMVNGLTVDAQGNVFYASRSSVSMLKRVQSDKQK